MKKEFDPSRRRTIALVGTVVGSVVVGNGIGLLGIWGGRVGEDVAKHFGVIENPPITVYPDQLLAAQRVSEKGTPGSEQWQKAREIISNENKVQEERYIQRYNMNVNLFRWGVFLGPTGLAILSRFSGPLRPDPKR